MDYDLLGDDFMGRVLVPLDTLFDKTRDQSWHVVGGKEGAEDGKSRGEIELALHWWFNPELQPEFFDKPEDEVSVIKRARTCVSAAATWPYAPCLLCVSMCYVAPTFVCGVRW